MWGLLGTGLSQTLYYGTFALLAGVCITMLARALWPPLDLHRAACCGACGHAVADILEGRCPECGGSYAKIGISTPSMAVRLRSGLVLALLAWTTLMLVGATITHGWLLERAMMAFQSVAAGVQPAGGPKTDSMSGEFYPWTYDSFGREEGEGDSTELDFRISFSLTAVSDAGKVTSGTSQLDLQKNGTAEFSQLTLDLADGSYSLKDSAGKEIETGDGVDEALIERWFTLASLKTGSEAVKRSMSDAMKIIRFSRNDPAGLNNLNTSVNSSAGDRGALQNRGISSFGGGFTATSGFAVSSGGIEAFTLAIAGGALGIFYLAGCAAIIWRHRRIVRA